MRAYSKYDSTLTREKNHSARKTGWIFLVLTTGILGALFAADWIHEDEIFLIKSVQVEGARFISEEEIRSLAKVDFMKNIFEIDGSAISARVKKHEFVDKVKVRRRLPSSLVIEVTEKKPLAVLNSSELAAIDDCGNKLPECGIQALHDYPVISSIDFSENPDSEFIKVVDFLKSIKTNNFTLYTIISEVSYSEKIGIYFTLNDKAIPVFVGEGNFTKKGAHFLKVYHIIQNKHNFSGIEYFDLRFKNQVIIKEATT